MRKEFKNADGKIEFCDEVVESMWDYIKIRQGSLWGVVDEDYEEILPCKYEEVVVFPQGRMGAKQKEKWGLFDAKGEQIIPCEYDHIDMEVEYHGYFYGCNASGENACGDYVCVELEGKKGLFYKKDGKMVLPCKYEDIKIIWPGDYIMVRLDGKCGIVNEVGGEVVPCIYDHVEVEDHPKDRYATFVLDGRICRRYDNGEVYWD